LARIGQIYTDGFNLKTYGANNNTTGVARNFDLAEGNKIEKCCGIILVTFFGYAVMMTSLNDAMTDFLKV